MKHATEKIHPEPFGEHSRWQGGGSWGLVLPDGESPLDYRLLLDAVSLHAALCIVDGGGTIHYVNEKLCAVSGFDANELVGRSYRRLLPEGEGNADEDGLWHALANGCIWRGELKQRSRFETEFWTETTVVPVADEPGAGLYLFVQTEITGFKQAQVVLQTSEEKHRALLEQANDAILLVDMDGWLIVANQRAERLTGYSREELTNMHMQQLVPPGARSRLLDLHQEVLEQRCSSFHGGLLLGKNGDVTPVDLSCAVVEFGGQRVIQSILRDITSRKMIETELIRARIVAERASRAKTEFISRISHELRTPLNAILGFGQLLQTDESTPLADPHREGINQILSAGWHLLELIEDVLNFSQIETGNLRITPAAVDVGDVLQECRDMLEPLARERNVTVEPMPMPQRVVVLADPVRLKEILLNLGSNAIKYNKINGCVSFSVVVESGRARINISDTGIGIRPEQMRQLFEPFDRLGQEDSAIQGTGLGLVIARRLAELMGGKLGVWSEPGVGSTFWIDLKLME